MFTSDSGRMYWDLDDSTRIEITDIIELSNESARTGLASPLEKFYFVLSTGILWRFQNGIWKEVGGSGGGGGESSILSDVEPLGQGEDATWLEVLQ